MRASLLLALAVPVASFGFRGGPNKVAAKKPAADFITFEEMEGGFGFAEKNAFKVARAFPGMQSFFREAELKHGRVSMLAAVGFPLAEQFHPLWGGDIDVPAYVAFQATPLETFWPVVVAVIALVEGSSAIPTFAALDGGQWFRIKPGHVAGDLGFDPLNLAEKADYRGVELLNGRLAMLAIAGMVAQELNTGQPLF